MNETLQHVVEVHAGEVERLRLGLWFVGHAGSVTGTGDKMRYEYALMFRSAMVSDLQASDGIVKALNDFLSLQLMNDVNAELDEYEGGGWELVSHSTALVEGEFVVSFLARRALESPPPD